MTTQPVSQAVPVGRSVTFSVTASGTAPLGYQWQRNGTNISGATSASYTLPSVTLADSGAAFRCIVSNAYGSAASNTAILTVTSNRVPTGTITPPAAGTLYNAGDTISYSGAVTDPEEGTLPTSVFTWEVVFHHDTHTHPFIPPTTVPRADHSSFPLLVRPRPMCGIESTSR
jgi:Immunoglobulin domain